MVPRERTPYYWGMDEDAKIDALKLRLAENRQRREDWRLQRINLTPDELDKLGFQIKQDEQFLESLGVSLT